jgi:hypothetical protein
LVPATGSVPARQRALLGFAHVDSRGHAGTAVATVVLAAFAIVSAGLAYSAFRAQAAEVRTLRKEHAREAAERRRTQACKVFVWERRVDVNTLGKPTAHEVNAHLLNTSQQPIYDVRFIWHVGETVQNKIVRGTPLMPGEPDMNPGRVPPDVDPGLFGVSVTFRDAAGLYWRARPNGSLEGPTEPDVDEPARRPGQKSMASMATEQEPPAAHELPAAPQLPAPAGGEQKPGRLSKISNNAVVAAIVAGIISLVVSLVVTHIQNDNTNSQAANGQQVQSAQDLEAAATSLYQSTTDVYNYQLKCVPGGTWQVCVAEALQIYPNYSSSVTAFGAASSNIVDRTASQLANQLGSEAGAMIQPQSLNDAHKLWYELVTTYTNLIGRCGKLVQA